MNFRDAEQLLNASLLYAGPPLLIVGKNGIGKTAMINEMVSRFKKAVFIPERIDFGGLKQAEMQIKNMHIKTVAISDMQNILSRKGGVRNATMGLLSSWMSEGIGGNELGFGNVNLSNKVDKRRKYTVNIIAACTFNHLAQMFRLGYSDFLDRMVIVIVERNKSDFYQDGFSLAVPPVYNPDKYKYNLAMSLDIKADTQRHTLYVKKIVAELFSIGVNPIDFLLENRTSISMLNTNEGNVSNIAHMLSTLSETDILKIKEAFGSVENQASV